MPLPINTSVWYHIGMSIGILMVCIGFLGFACESSAGNNATSATKGDAKHTKNIFPHDYAQVCLGNAISEAAPYNRENPDKKPIYLFEQTESGKSYQQIMNRLPKEWEPNPEDAEQIQVVACISLKEKTKKKDCTTTIREDTFTTSLYNAKYEVRLMEAATATLIASTQLNLQAGDCPRFGQFSGGSTVTVHYPDYTQPLTSFLSPYILSDYILSNSHPKEHP